MRLASDRRGVAAIEFAIIAPIFLLLLLATFDLVQYLRTQLRLDTIAVQVGQNVSQCNQITTPGDTDQFWSDAQQIAGSAVDFTNPLGGAIIVSAIYLSNGANKVAWQIRKGNSLFKSNIDVTGQTTPVLSSFLVPTGQTLITTEVFTNANPWVLSSAFMGGIKTNTLYGNSLLLSRSTNPVQLQQTPTASNATVCMS
jgi:Flp pilus assembly protein TadG